MALNTETIAEVCHEANRVLQRYYLHPVSPHWDELDAETKESVRDGVVNAMGGATPRESHENWMRFKLDHGWSYGEVKSLEHKTHPLLVPYDELPRHQQVKDKLFISIVRTLA